MVTAKIFDVLCAMIAWFVGLFPTFTVPSWWTSVTTWLDGLGTIGVFGNVIPLQAIATSAAALAGATVAVTAISTSRVVYSMVTGGGGAK